MDGNENFVKVTIYGQEYTIKAPADATYIKNIAEYVDEKMREVQEELSTPQVPAKIAILAAMNISDDLFAQKRNHEKSNNEVERKVSSLIEVVEEAIQQ
ncbi:MAG: cell division protein ZapA [Candidatus Neomarinimicrobiota bacterium]|jgi:cell division protein ZapA|nr:cell division protein ZapA [Candidatus Neomarinimicrobiota bacterium]HBH11240.1 cell division protein ZapA [Gammaproteobacteria bacterium]|tara:strand:+ start:453 stop:749 length:297 start_codon:yes stop_codon:yes gene_type:complete